MNQLPAGYLEEQVHAEGPALGKQNEFKEKEMNFMRANLIDAVWIKRRDYHTNSVESFYENSETGPGNLIRYIFVQTEIQTRRLR